MLCCPGFLCRACNLLVGPASISIDKVPEEQKGTGQDHRVCLCLIAFLGHMVGPILAHAKGNVLDKRNIFIDVCVFVCVSVSLSGM